ERRAHDLRAIRQRAGRLRRHLCRRHPRERADARWGGGAHWSHGGGRRGWRLGGGVTPRPYVSRSFTSTSIVRRRRKRKRRCSLRLLEIARAQEILNVE